MTLFLTKPARLDLRKHFFSVRIPPIWNALPLPVRQSTSVNQFKNSYDKFKKKSICLERKGRKNKQKPQTDLAHRAKFCHLSLFGTGCIVSVLPNCALSTTWQILVLPNLISPTFQPKNINRQETSRRARLSRNDGHMSFKQAKSANEFTIVYDIFLETNMDKICLGETD